MKRRVLIGGAMAAGVAAGLPLTSSSAEEKAGKAVRAVAKVDDGSVVNVPLAKRSGPKSVVYFTRDLSADGLRKIVAKVSSVLTGKVAVKLHTGEKGGPNILPREWVKELLANDIKNATIVETNTYYPGDRDTTAKHLDTLKVNGWTFAPVDIMDAEGTAMIPVKGAKHIKEISVGKGLLKYDSLLTLTHFKGHTMGGFGGSNKNISIGWPTRTQVRSSCTPGLPVSSGVLPDANLWKTWSMPPKALQTTSRAMSATSTCCAA